MNNRCLICYKKNCLCSDIVTVESRVKLVILQHPDERTHPLGTAKIVELAIPGTQLWVEKDFSQHQPLQDIVDATHSNDSITTLLLFPSPNAIDANHWSNENLSTDPVDRQNQLNNLTIIILDGTWRKARKIYHSTPCLQSLPSLSLATDQPSDYTLRKSKHQDQLSTLESIVHLLNTLDSEQEKSFDVLLKPFNKMIENQIQKMGKDTFSKNYPQD